MDQKEEAGPSTTITLTHPQRSTVDRVSLTTKCSGIKQFSQIFRYICGCQSIHRHNRHLTDHGDKAELIAMENSLTSSDLQPESEEVGAVAGPWTTAEYQHPSTLPPTLVTCAKSVAHVCKMVNNLDINSVMRYRLPSTVITIERSRQGSTPPVQGNKVCQMLSWRTKNPL